MGLKKSPPNMVLVELKHESKKYKEAHESAQDNNTALHRAITQHHSNLKVLSQPLEQIIASIPSVKSVESECRRHVLMLKNILKWVYLISCVQSFVY